MHTQGVPEAQSSPREFTRAYFQDRPEYDEGFESALDDGLTHVSTDSSTRRVVESSYAPEPVGVVQAPALSRKFITLGIVTIAVLALILLTLNVFDQRGAAHSEEEYVPGVATDDFSRPTVESGTINDQVTSGFGKQQANPGPEINSVEAVDSPEPLPTNIEVEVQESIPEAFVDDGTTTVSESLGTIDENELAAADITKDVDNSKDADLVEQSVESTPSESAPGSTISINFTFDSDQLIPDTYDALDKAVVMLRENPESIADITGFTDSQGDEYYNLQLSRKRADAVKQYLVEAGIEHERLHVEGRGALMELAGDHGSDDEDPMRPNRVVQIRLSGDHAE